MWAFLKLETAAPSLDILAGANASAAPALPPPPPPPPPLETADLAALFSLPPSGKGRFGHISYMMASLLCTYAVAGVVRSYEHSFACCFTLMSQYSVGKQQPHVRGLPHHKLAQIFTLLHA